MDSFVAFDFETANFDPTSICEIAFVKFEGIREDRDYPALYTLLRPMGKLEVGAQQTLIHGITKKDLKSAPKLGDVWSEISDFIGDLPLVAHNATQDFNKLAEALFSQGESLPNLHFYCTLTLARNIPSVVTDTDFKLENLADLLDVEWSEIPRPSGIAGHSALLDALATGEIMHRLLGEYEGSFEAMLSELNMKPGTVREGVVTHGNIKIKDTSFFNRYASYNETTFQERVEFLKSAGYAQKLGTPLENSNVVITLELESLSVNEFWDCMALVGANFKSSVTSKVNFLVEGSVDPKGQYERGETSKSVKALELNESGKAKIRILDEDQLIELIGTEIVDLAKEIKAKGL